MRKGQIEILERAKRYGYSEYLIGQLSREDMTLRELNILFSRCYFCKDFDDDWVQAYLKITDWMIIDIIHLCRSNDIILTVSDLKQFSTIEDVYKFFSHDGVVCKSLGDIRVVIYRKGVYDEYLNSFIRLSHRFYEHEKQTLDDDVTYDNYMSCHMIHSTINYLGKYAASILDFDEFVDSIDFDYDIKYDNLSESIKQWQYEHHSFRLSDASGLSEDLRSIDFKGYTGVINAYGNSRKVSYGNSCYTIVYYPFEKVNIDKYGQLITVPKKRKSRTIMLFYKDMSFVTKYETKTGYKNKPTSLKELFDAISIFDSDADKQDAKVFVNQLCEIYGTYIFRDLYEDYLASDGFLLPCLVKNVVHYHNKHDLMVSLYHCNDICVNLNKRNVNAVYALSKIQNRMTDEAFAKALQINDIKVIHVGRQRWKFAYILYTALYDVKNYDRYLLEDSIREEYEHKQISLLRPKTIMSRHNARQLVLKAKKLQFKIKKDTKFRKLIDNMPEEYELISTPRRLITETNLQHNCVATSDFYANRINRDLALLYSVVYNGDRHTIEIEMSSGKYMIRQCYKACNKPADRELIKELNQIIKNINKIRG